PARSLRCRVVTAGDAGGHNDRIRLVPLSPTPVRDRRSIHRATGRTALPPPTCRGSGVLRPRAPMHRERRRGSRGSPGWQRGTGPACHFGSAGRTPGQGRCRVRTGAVLPGHSLGGGLHGRFGSRPALGTCPVRISTVATAHGAPELVLRSRLRGVLAEP